VGSTSCQGGCRFMGAQTRDRDTQILLVAIPGTHTCLRLMPTCLSLKFRSELSTLTASAFAVTVFACRLLEPVTAVCSLRTHPYTSLPGWWSDTSVWRMDEALNPCLPEI
jgi:hypothetical protein